jgi:glycosyltransferase involved in cell wall biosynthesis
MTSPEISVLITTYRGDDPDELSTALESVIEQTLSPSEIVLIKDGPVTAELDETITSYQDNHPDLFSISELETNQGQGKARRVGVEKVNNELVAMMDADDISLPSRFQQQADYLQDNPEIDAVGGYIAEFGSDPQNTHAIRKVPTEPDVVARKARFRSPLNQTTVMARKKAILDAGNYRATDRMEDYDLWARMLTDDATLANIPEVLAKVRAGSEMYERRGGWEYASEEIRQQREFLRMGFVSRSIALLNIAIRVPTRLLPNRFRSVLYSRILRRDTT